MTDTHPISICVYLPVATWRPLLDSIFTENISHFSDRKNPLNASKWVDGNESIGLVAHWHLTNFPLWILNISFWKSERVNWSANVCVLCAVTMTNQKRKTSEWISIRNRLHAVDMRTDELFTSSIHRSQ